MHRTLFVLLVVFVFLNLFRHQWAVDVRTSSDDAANLAWAMTLGLDFDLDFSNEVNFGAYTSANRDVPKGFYGTGLMAAPFVAAFSVVDRLGGHAVIGDHNQFVHSWSYFGFSFAAHFYFLSAVYLFWRSAKAFPRPPGIALTFLLCASSGVIYFVLDRVRMSHAFEFFALALVVYATARTWEAAQSGARAAVWIAIAAFAVALTLAVRFNDLNVILLPLLVFALVLVARGQHGAHARPQRFLGPAGAYLALVIALYLPFAALNARLYSVWIPTPATVYRHSSAYRETSRIPEIDGIGDLGAVLAKWFGLLPEIPYVLFSAEFGLLYSSPVTVIGLGVLGVVLLARSPSEDRWFRGLVLTGALAYALFSLSIVLFWGSTASSFGWRYLYPLFPLGFVGYCAWRSRAASTTGGSVALRNGIHAALVGLCVFSVLGAVMFTRSPALSYRIGTTHFGIEAASAPDYETNLVREIVNPKIWDTRMKDGVIGYLKKSYVNQSYLRWLFKGVLLGDETVEKPRERHPPIVGLNILILGVLWAVFLRAFLRLDRQPAAWAPVAAPVGA